MRAMIFANGDLPHPELVPYMLRPDDLLIAADGGARHLAELGLRPQLAIGDFDSLATPEVEFLSTQGVEIIRHPAHKDFTDLELALREARQRGCDSILVFAALGHRWDQSLANLLLLAAPGLEGVAIRLVEGSQEITLLQPQRTVTVQGRPGDTLSLIPIAGDAHGITTDGLEYPLDNETLHFGATRGVSNSLLGQQASIHFEQGLLLCTLIHH